MSVRKPLKNVSVDLALGLPVSNQLLCVEGFLIGRHLGFTRSVQGQKYILEYRTRMEQFFSVALLHLNTGVHLIFITTLAQKKTSLKAF